MTLVAPSPATASTSWLDSDFNPNVSTANSQVSVVALQSDGKILIGGDFTSVGGQTRKTIARLNSDGTLDETFIDANVEKDHPGASVNAIAIQSDGKILIGGDFLRVSGVTRNYMARLNSDGTLDPTFNPSPNGFVRSIVIDSSGGVVVGGDFTTIASTARNRMARLNSGGTLDPTFNPNISFSSVFTPNVRSILIQSDGKIIFGGEFDRVVGGPGTGEASTRNRIARLESNGTLDSTFNPNLNAAVRTIVAFTGTDLLIGGDFTSVGGVTHNRIARLDSSGNLVPAFNPNPDGGVHAISVQSDDRTLIGGNFSKIGSDDRYFLARLSSSGSLDAAFNLRLGASVNTLVRESSGKSVVGGVFTCVGGGNFSCTSPAFTWNRIARLNAKISQTVTWSPTTAITTAQSPLTPSAAASTTGDGAITYSKVSNTSTTCTVDSSTGALTYSGAGNCVVRATAAATATYLVGTTDVTFTITASGGGGSGGGGGSSSSGSSSDSGSTTAPSVTPATPTPAPQSTGAVAFVPTNEKPGEAGVLIGGKAVTPTVTPAGRNETLIRAGDLQLGIKGGSSGGATGSSGGAALVLTPGRPVEIAGDGAQPNSFIQQAIFSKPVQLAPTTANAKGEFVASSRVPTTLKPGNHTLQITGRTKTGEPFVLSVGVVVARASVTQNAIVKFRPASAELTKSAKVNLRKLVTQAKGKQVKQARIDGKTFYIAADFARELARERVAAISAQLRKLGVKQKIQKRVVPTKEIKDRQVRTYEVSLRAS